MALSRSLDLTKGGLGLLHTGRRIIAVGREGVHALAEHERIGTFRISGAQIHAFVPAGEMIRHPGNALADPLGHQRLHAGPRTILRARHPNPSTVLDAALARIRRIDFDKHMLLQLRQPLVGTRFLAATLILYESAGAQDQRKLSGNAPVDGRLLYGKADVGYAELLGIRQGRIIGDEVRTRGIDRLAMNGYRVGKIPGNHSRLAVSIR